MPGFKSHYLFGKNALANFTPDKHEQFLVNHPKSYNLGLQGPDVFFYHLPSWLFYKENIGDKIHASSSTSFFEALIAARNTLTQKRSRNVADAYICGFMGHYTLDVYCHPYIYYRTKKLEHKDKPLKDFGMHVFLETDIDNALLRHYTHLRPSEFMMGSTIFLPIYEHGVIALLLFRAIKIAFPGSKVKLTHINGAMQAMRREANLMKDPTSIKKRTIRKIEQLILGHAFISSMIPNDNVTKYKDPCNLRRKKWRNPWAKDQVTSDSVYDLIAKANVDFERRIHLYAKAHTLSKDYTAEEKETSLVKLYEDLGDLSYLSGLPCE